MKQNSKSEFIKIVRDEGSKYNPPMIQKGTVKSVNPMQIVVGELPLFENNLDMDKRLLGYTETVIIKDDTGTKSATIVHEPVLDINDVVFLYPIENGQKYIVFGVV
ncbi:DUF2577 domain-containing protein [Clostridium saccharobutylicum]|uniref:Uncharacterized protein n=1 Tax=Clostridium saccharobutylicum DSM 13864 TaxID=1345695 RepID=U5MWZ0_CLOSA|nr:DUF2577 domain-containing protein [Clostridium saccharobutylicum]AGX43947.1 hypothetical protein CLSA_c29800 [Clostridium saccharobutylicum DSM 13864]AQR91245.1 hypothetical protein CLOSC_29690 [Clostridium saccharobutylicum]AQS01149.1 hypothetical protein CSACC_29760 [Clostridium saccharobutylicum]AQS10562.1 hypothetical protein CLOBY_27070 [Clostridium saccharobutylicum]AQS15132.1 hypothetical protein CLOSACC_29760 [Clostridium saccharobutylicum]